MTAYGMAGDEPVGTDVFAARMALAEGLAALRSSVRAMLRSDREDAAPGRRDPAPHRREAVRNPGEAAPGRREPASHRGDAAANRRDPAPNRSEAPGRRDAASPRARNRPHSTDAPRQSGVNARPVGRSPVPTRRPAEFPEVGDPQRPDTGSGPGTTPAPGGPVGGAHAPDPEPVETLFEVRALVERAQAGETAAFGLIYDRYFDTVFRFVYFRVGNRQLAEDLTADTFLRALRRIGSFTWQGRDFGAWLVTISRNLVADHFKSSRYRLEITTGDVLDTEREERGPEGSPESAVLDRITNVALLCAVRQLNPEQQECIVLRFLNGFSVAETALAMNKNEGAIKALQYRAVRALARLLPDGFER
jgi:RNA polymerase sigma-70 factor (ECF subfamily)